MSDNGPQFISREFEEFCQSWGIDHVTSSPYYARSNGLVERTIGTIKKTFKKCKESGNDIYLALLNLRNSCPNFGESPAKLLMARNLRTKMPVVAKDLKTKPVSYKNYIKSQVNRKNKMKYFHDRNARNLSKLKVNDKVYFKKFPTYSWSPGIIESMPANDTPISYIVKTPEGVCYRRNRVHINEGNCKQNKTFENVSQSCFTEDQNTTVLSNVNDQVDLTEPGFSSYGRKLKKRKRFTFSEYD